MGGAELKGSYVDPSNVETAPSTPTLAQLLLQNPPLHCRDLGKIYFAAVRPGGYNLHNVCFIVPKQDALSTVHCFWTKERKQAGQCACP